MNSYFCEIYNNANTRLTRKFRHFEWESHTLASAVCTENAWFTPASGGAGAGRRQSGAKADPLPPWGSGCVRRREIGIASRAFAADEP